MIALPGKADINLLEPFTCLGREDVQMVVTQQQAEAALAGLEAVTVVGFDTESKPTFRVGEQSEGPHVVQFATLDRAFVFQVHEAAVYDTLAMILASQVIIKVGFGLGSDVANIARRFGVQPGGIVDLNARFSALGYRKTIGARQAIAMLFGKRFIKSRKTSTSNWANRTLTDRQILYAANDAYAAVRVHQALLAADANGKAYAKDERLISP